MDVEYARVPIRFGLMNGQVLRFQVAVSEGNEPPNQRKNEPRYEESQSENDDCPTPLDID